MQVKSWMSSPVHTVGPAACVAQAAEIMRRHRIRHLPVSEGDRVVGVVTDRDLQDMGSEVPVATIMSRPVLVVSPRTAVDKAARLLFDRRIGCLPVIEDGKLVGIVTQTDAVAALVDVVRIQVGGRHAEVVVQYRPDAMRLAHQALRQLDANVARLVSATREPFQPGHVPQHVRLEIETREMAGVLDALQAAGLTVLSTADHG